MEPAAPRAEPQRAEDEQPRDGESESSDGDDRGDKQPDARLAHVERGIDDERAPAPNASEVVPGECDEPELPRDAAEPPDANTPRVCATEVRDRRYRPDQRDAGSDPDRGSNRRAPDRRARERRARPEHRDDHDRGA